MFVRINGNIHYLWRSVDQEGEVLEAYVTKSRNRKAALMFLRKAMKRYGRPKTIVTDKLGSYRAALRTIGNGACQETGHWLNNRAENSHQPLRRRERAMQRFRQMRTLQKFAAVHSSVGIVTLLEIAANHSEICDLRQQRSVPSIAETLGLEILSWCDGT